MRRNCQNWARGRRLAGWLLIVSLLSAWLPTVEGQEFVEQRTLPNGLRVWVSPQEEPPRVLVGLVVLAGEADTAPWPRQTAHLLEHLLSQSRAGESKEELNREIRERGCYTRPTTHPVFTEFWANGPPDELPFLLELLRDLVLENDLAGKDIEKEKDLVIAEFDGEPSWYMKAYERLRGLSVWNKIYAQLLPNSRVFQSQAFPTVDLPLIDRSALERFYERFYSPSRAVLIVVGPVDAQETLELAGAVYGGVSARATPDWSLPRPPHPQKLVEVHRWRPVVFARGGWVLCGVRLDDWSGRRAFGGALLRKVLEERLYDELVVRRALLYSAWVQSWLPTDTGVLYSSVVAHGGIFQEVAEVMKAEYLRLGREGLSAEEFTRLKKSVESGLRHSLTDVPYRAGLLTRRAMRLREGGGDLSISSFTLPSLDHQEVNDLAREIFREDNMFVAVSRPLLNVWQSTLALIIIVAVFVGFIVLAVRWRRRAKKATAQAAQS